MKPERILVVLPHPDDEVFPMSGTLAKYIKEGAYVTYACLTLGEMGRNLGNPAFANRVSLPMVRKKELQNSCKVIGIQDLRMLGYHDKTIEFEDYELLDQRILGLIEEVKPELIFTYYPGHGVHPDHNACGEAVIRTVRKMNPSERPIVHCCAFPNENLGKPDLVIDVTPFLELKVGAIKAHSSQFSAANNLAPGSKDDAVFMERIKIERFWTYRFEA